MFRPRIGQQVLMAIALGLVLPALSWAATVTVSKPFNSFGTYGGPGGQLPSLSIVNSISINNNGAAAPNTVYFGTLDLKNNDIIIRPAVQDEAHAVSTFNAVYDMVRSGYNMFAWDGTGITSSIANVDQVGPNAQGALALGVIRNDDGTGIPIWGGVAGTDSFNGPFDGDANLTNFDTIVKYTFFGDLQLRGKIDGNDTSFIFNNNHVTPTTNQWLNGLLFYGATGNTIGGSDSSAAFNNQSLQNNFPYVVNFGAQTAGLSVPEPSSVILVLAGVAVAGLARLRNRSRRRNA